MLERRPARVERAEEIDVDHGFESVCRHPECRSWKIAGGSAYDDVDASETFMCGRARRRERVVVANVCRERGGLAALCFDLSNGGVQFFLRSTHKHNTGTMLGESVRNGEVDSASSACNECNLAIENACAKNRRHELLRI